MISLVGFLLISIFIAYKKEMKLIYTIPLCTSGLLFILYFLAMIRKLKYIDAIGAIFILFFLVLCIIKRKEIGFKKIGALFLDGSFIALLTGIVFITIVVRGKLSSSWDDLSCWAYQTKTLFMLNGFNSRGMSAGLSYETYIPGQMLFSWWFCRFNPSNYYEGLMYAGYYSLFLIILSPLFSIFKFKKFGVVKAIPLGILFSMFLLLFPSIINTSQYNMIAVELSQGAAAGIILVLMLSTIKDIDERTKELLWVSTIIILAFLKSSSLYFIILFSIFALILRKINNNDGLGIKPVLIGFVFTAFINVTWKVFCNFSGRGWQADDRGTTFFKNLSAYFSGSNGKLVKESNEYASSFFYAVNNYPLHIEAKSLDSGFGINFTLLLIILLIFISLLLFSKFGLYDWKKKELLSVEIFSLLVIVIYVFSILFMIMFFFGEKAYIKPQAVIGTLSRYLEPVLLSFLLFILGSLLFKNKMSAGTNIIIFILMLLCFDFPSYFDGLFMYGDRSKNAVSMTSDVTTQNENFVSSVNTNYQLRDECKIYFLVDSEDTNLYCRLRYAMAPKSITFYSLDVDNNESAFNKLKSFCEDNLNNAEIYIDSDNFAKEHGLEPHTLYSTQDALAILK